MKTFEKNDQNRVEVFITLCQHPICTMMLKTQRILLGSSYYIILKQKYEYIGQSNNIKNYLEITNLNVYPLFKDFLNCFFNAIFTIINSFQKNTVI